MEPFKDYFDAVFDTDENHICYSIEKGIVKRKKKSWETVQRVDTGTIQPTDVFVDKSTMYLNDTDGSFHMISFE